MMWRLHLSFSTSAGASPLQPSVLTSPQGDFGLPSGFREKKASDFSRMLIWSGLPSLALWVRMHCVYNSRKYRWGGGWFKLNQAGLQRCLIFSGKSVCLHLGRASMDQRNNCTQVQLGKQVTFLGFWGTSRGREKQMQTPHHVTALFLSLSTVTSLGWCWTYRPWVDSMLYDLGSCIRSMGEVSLHELNHWVLCNNSVRPTPWASPLLWQGVLLI